MFTSLTVVSFFFAFAWIQQIFLNQLIQDDLEQLKQSRPDFPRHFPKEESDPNFHPTDS